MQDKNHSINIGIKCFERVEQVKYLATNVTNQNSIRIRLTTGNACYHLVQNLLSSSSLSKNIKIKICKTIILPVIFHGYETWCFTLRKIYWLRVSENSMLMRIYGPTRDEVTGQRELYDLYVSPNTTGVITPTGMRWARRVSTPSIHGRWEDILK